MGNNKYNTYALEKNSYLKNKLEICRKKEMIQIKLTYLLPKKIVIATPCVILNSLQLAS